MLKEIHIGYFYSLLRNCSNYDRRSSLDIFVVEPYAIEPISEKDDYHKQILFSCSDFYDFKTFDIGHWVCTYFDIKCIYVYDSLG